MGARLVNFPLDSGTLGEARDWLRAHAAKGEGCPCCRQFVKVYRRKLNSGMARALILFYQLDRAGEPGRWLHWRDASGSIAAFCAEYSKLAYWGLMEPKPHTPDDKKSSGLWRLTPAGRSFVRNESTVLSHARIYNSQLLGSDGGWISIVDALGKRFHYPELMEQRPISGEPS